jgi:hypothetical protein
MKIYTAKINNFYFVCKKQGNLFKNTNFSESCTVHCTVQYGVVQKEKYQHSDINKLYALCNI